MSFTGGLNIGRPRNRRQRSTFEQRVEQLAATRTPTPAEKFSELKNDADATADFLKRATRIMIAEDGGNVRGFDAQRRREELVRAEERIRHEERRRLAARNDPVESDDEETFGWLDRAMSLEPEYALGVAPDAADAWLDDDANWQDDEYVDDEEY